MQPRSVERIRHLGQLACAGAFVLVVFAPLLDQLLRPASARDTTGEMRVPAERPRLTLDATELESFPRRFEDWHRDTFGLRDVLLRWHNVLRWFVLRTSPTSRIVLGEQDWIFLRARALMDDHRGTLPMHPLELEQWRVFLERRRDWLAERGSSFVFVLVPNKNQVYPELVPERFAPVGPTRMDQLADYMRAHSDLELLDLRPVLRAERRQDRGDDLTYFPLGTHWTERGAFAGYCALVERLAETRTELAPLAPEAFDIEREDGLGDNWGGRLYMRDLLTQAYLAWTLRAPRAREVEATAGDRRAVYERPEAPQLPTGLLLHDSFGLPLRPWLAEHFSRLECEWTTRFDAEAVDRTRPDFVIQLYSEFTLVPFMPQPTELEDEGATRARFEASGEVLWRLEDLQDVGALESGSTLALEDGVLRLERRGPEETLLLPPLDLPGGRTLLLLVEVEAPQDDSLYLLYQTRRERSYDRTRSMQATLREGRSSICLVLPPRGYTGRLDLHVGIRPGTFELHRIELRTEAP